MYNITESASKHRPSIENIIGDRVWQSLNKMIYFCHERNRINWVCYSPAKLGISICTI